MKLFDRKYIRLVSILSAAICAGLSCQKIGSVPSTFGVSALTVVNAIPTSTSVIPVINTTTPIIYFNTAQPIYYGSFYEYSPPGGNDTVDVVQNNGDTLDYGQKNAGLLYSNILKLYRNGIYSLFLCGSDTIAPDFVFTSDTLPYHASTDSAVGIRFANLSADSNPISINIEGESNGSEVSSLLYKGVTGFKNYISNSKVNNYLFVIRDGATGDSLTQISLNGNGVGLIDPNNGNELTFKNVTIAVYGLEFSMSGFPISAMLIDNY